MIMLQNPEVTLMSVNTSDTWQLQCIECWLALSQSECADANWLSHAQGQALLQVAQSATLSDTEQERLSSLL